MHCLDHRSFFTRKQTFFGLNSAGIRHKRQSVPHILDRIVVPFGASYTLWTRAPWPMSATCLTSWAGRNLHGNQPDSPAHSLDERSVADALVSQEGVAKYSNHARGEGQQPDDVTAGGALHAVHRFHQRVVCARMKSGAGFIKLPYEQKCSWVRLTHRTSRHFPYVCINENKSSWVLFVSLRSLAVEPRFSGRSEPVN